MMIQTERVEAKRPSVTKIEVRDNAGTKLEEVSFATILGVNAFTTGLFKDWEILEHDSEGDENISIIKLVIGRRLCWTCKDPIDIPDKNGLPYCQCCMEVAEHQRSEEEEE